MQRSTNILRSIRPTALLRGYATKADSTVTKGPAGPVLYTTKVVVEGARNGHVKGEGLDLGLTMSKALGGSGLQNHSNPEELFAGEFTELNERNEHSVGYEREGDASFASQGRDVNGGLGEQRRRHSKCGRRTGSYRPRDTRKVPRDAVEALRRRTMFADATAP